MSLQRIKHCLRCFSLSLTLCLISCGGSDDIQSKITLFANYSDKLEQAHQSGNAKDFIRAANGMNELIPFFIDSNGSPSTEIILLTETEDNNTVASLNKLRFAFEKIYLHYGPVIVKPKTKRPLDIKLHNEIISDTYFLECVQNHNNIMNYIFRNN